MLGAVGVTFLVVVLVAGGKRQAGDGVEPQGALEGAERAVLLHVERVLALLPAQTEGETDTGQVAHPVGELDVDDVASIFGDGVDLF